MFQLFGGYFEITVPWPHGAININEAFEIEPFASFALDDRVSRENARICHDPTIGANHLGAAWKARAGGGSNTTTKTTKPRNKFIPNILPYFEHPETEEPIMKLKHRTC